MGNLKQRKIFKPGIDGQYCKEREWKVVDLILVA